MGLSLGDKKLTQLQSLLSVNELNKRYAVTNHQQTLKSDMRTSLVVQWLGLCFQHRERKFSPWSLT